jgi:hypothetical protein
MDDPAAGPVADVDVIVAIPRRGVELAAHAARWRARSPGLALGLIYASRDPVRARPRRRVRLAGGATVLRSFAGPRAHHAGLIAAGMRAATAPIVIVADRALVPDDGMVRALLAAFARRPAIGIAVPAIHLRGRAVRTDEPAGCYAIRRELLVALHGVRTRYERAPIVDRDLWLRARVLGAELAHVDRAIVQAPPSWRPPRTPATARGARRFAIRWLGAGAPVHAPRALDDGAGTLPRSPPARRRMPLVIYTAVTDAYDQLRPQPGSAGDVDYLAFVDATTRAGLAAMATPSPWQLRALPRTRTDGNRDAKTYKIRPHLHLPPHRFSLWIDGCVSIVAPFDVAELVARYLGDADLCILRHRTRTCIYQEARVCIGRRLDDPAIIRAQMRGYRAAGYPADAGLAEATVILRRNCAATARFGDAWWHEIERGSRRDQLSFPVVARATGLRFRTFGLRLSDVGLFHRGPHAA